MGMMSKRKGKSGEREAAKELGALLGVTSRRGVQFQGGPDSPDVVLDGVPLHVECKRTETLSLYTAIAQAVADCPGSSVPIVWHRRSRQNSLVALRTQDIVRFAAAVMSAVNAYTPVDGATDAEERTM